MLLSPTRELAVGDRVICRHNDRAVDNGMRGTVRHLNAERVVIDTDGGLVRELPASYVAEYLDHAYALTGHGMQGGTVRIMADSLAMLVGLAAVGYP